MDKILDKSILKTGRCLSEPLNSITMVTYLSPKSICQNQLLNIFDLPKISKLCLLDRNILNLKS